jgi:hypothetical protein
VGAPPLLETYAGDAAPPDALVMQLQPRTLRISARTQMSVGLAMSYVRVDARLDPLDYVGHRAHEVLTHFRASLSSFPIWLNDGNVGEAPFPWALGTLSMSRGDAFCFLTRALADPLVHRLLPFFAAAGDRLSIFLACVPIAATEDVVRFAVSGFEIGTQPARVG